MMLKKTILLSWALLAWALSSTAWGHKPSDSYLKITGGQEYLTAQWDIALRDLEYLVGLDVNRDGDITWGELKAQRQAIAAHAISRLRLVVDGRQADLHLTELLVNRHSDGNYAVLSLTTDCSGDATELEIHYGLMFDVDPTHRGLVLYDSGTVNSTHVLSPDTPTLTLRTSETNLARAFVSYTEEGVWHIWIGFDHILFLLTLLLPAVFVRVDNRWNPVEDFRPAGKSVLKIVTVFTLAHSLTLWLAVMEYVQLPGPLVESAIAFSIIVSAVNNLFAVLPISGWVIAFVFGLVHGFGFANVLIDLGLSNTTLAISLLGFNVGVELGQLAIVLLFFPLAFLLRQTKFYEWGIFRTGSVVVVIIASLWMVERIANVEIIGF